MSRDYREAKQARHLALLRSVHGSIVRNDESGPISFDGGARSENYHLTSDPMVDGLRLLHEGWIPVDQE